MCNYNKIQDNPFQYIGITINKAPVKITIKNLLYIT